MDWSDYLIEEKYSSAYPHLGVIKGTVDCPFDISELSKDAKIISMSTPLKKFKLKYTNYDSLIGNEKIEAISINDINEERLNAFSTLPNLQYLEISNCKQEMLPNLSSLKSLKVLLLSGITKSKDISFIGDLKKIETLYIYGFNNLYDLSPLEKMKSLKELWLDHGKMSGTGRAVRSMESLSKLKGLEYLDFILNVENKNYDISPLLELNNLKHLRILPRFLKNGQKEIIDKKLPNVNLV